MEQLQERICIEHATYLKNVARQENGRGKVEFPLKHITGELWPPTHQVVKEHYDLEKRSILLVGFAAKDAIDCIKCLMVYSEVFFVFAPSVSPVSGYVWMTQNHDDIIQSCFHRDCSKLWFYDDVDQL